MLLSSFAVIAKHNDNNELLQKPKLTYPGKPVGQIATQQLPAFFLPGQTGCSWWAINGESRGCFLFAFGADSAGYGRGCGGRACSRVTLSRARRVICNPPVRF